MSTPRNAAKDFELRSEERIAVRSLGRFKAGVHRIPKALDRRAEEWIAELAHDEVESDLARVHANLRAHLKYTRKQVEVVPSSTSDGFGSIRTPGFLYTISVALDPDDLTKAIFTRELSDIQNPDLLNDQGFAAIFDGVFNTIRLSFQKPIDVEELIDKAEAKQVPVDYPHDCSRCRFKVSDRGVISVTTAHFALAYPSPKPLGQLTTALSQALQMLPKSESPKPSLSRPTRRQLE